MMWSNKKAEPQLGQTRPDVLLSMAHDTHEAERLLP
jgi:hypothetical protein